MTLPDPPPSEVAPRDLAKLRTGAAPYAILDVREPWEARAAAFAQAIQVPLGLLPDCLACLPRDRTLIVVCHRSQRSWLATRHRRELGFARPTNLACGIDAWATSMPPCRDTEILTPLVGNRGLR